MYISPLLVSALCFLHSSFVFALVECELADISEAALFYAFIGHKTFACLFPFCWVESGHVLFFSLKLAFVMLFLFGFSRVEESILASIPFWNVLMCF